MHVQTSRCAVVFVLLTTLLAGCSRADPTTGAGGSTASPAAGIRIGAFDFPESRLVAELYRQALDAAGYPAPPVLQLGSREIVEPALEQGRIDVVPEYAGSALVFLQRGGKTAPADVERTHAELERLFAERGITVGRPARAQNQNAFVVTKGTAATFKVRTLSELAAVSEELVAGGPPECPQRRTCLGGLASVYDIKFRKFRSVSPASHVAAALIAGEIDLGVMFTTDADVPHNGFVVLEDDRHLQPAENLVPAVRTAVVERHGEGVLEALDEVSAALTTPRLARLNLAMKEGATVEKLAARWLRTHGITP